MRKFYLCEDEGEAGASGAGGDVGGRIGRYLSAHTVAVTDGKLKSGLMREEEEACSQEISAGKLSRKEES